MIGVTSVESGDTKYGRAAQGQHWGGGGPGGFPIPISTSMPSLPLNDPKAPWRFNLPEKRAGSTQAFDLETLRQSDGGEKVIVGILDTCPSDSDWTTAVDDYVTNADPPHPLLQSLKNLKDEGKFHLINKANDQGTLDDWEAALIQKHLDDHDYTTYPMVEHGLFVAGIIHSIAPKATIVLHRVLHDDGICLFTSVQEGFGHFHHARSEASLHDAPKWKPLIVNCSLSFGGDDKGQPQGLWDVINNAYNSVVVGAAGNEATYEPPYDPDNPPDPLPAPPLPCDPAGYTSTLGVSARNKKGNRASYANFADDFAKPPPQGTQRRGILTYGGESLNVEIIASNGDNLATRITDPSDSILGLYLSKDFPYSVRGKPTVSNATGWARWSGTSFSTAIISGVMALITSHEMGNGNAPPTSDQLITMLLDYCEPPQNDDNPDPEHILAVTQGPQT